MRLALSYILLGIALGTMLPLPVALPVYVVAVLAIEAVVFGVRKSADWLNQPMPEAQDDPDYEDFGYMR